MEIEGTPLQNQEFQAAVNRGQAPRDPFVADRERFYQRVQQSIEAEEFWPKDDIAQEDFMFEAVYERAEQGIITEHEAHHIFANWILRRRPDTTVMFIDRSMKLLT